MKKTLLAAALMGVVGVSYAQSGSVTLYGIVDTGYEFSSQKLDTHWNATNRSTSVKTKKSGLKSGGMSGPRLGFKGQEPLGNGLSATFHMEMRFNSATGAWRTHKTAAGETVTGFAARTLVGLKGPFGHFALGRENTPIDNNVFPMDIAGHTRSDVPLTYKVEGLFYNGQFGGLGVEATVGRNQSVTTENGVKIEDKLSEFGYGVGLKYSAGGFSIAGAAQQFRPGTIKRDARGNVTSDNRGRKDEFGLAVNYKLGDVRLVSNYIYAKSSPRHSNAYSRWEHLNFGVEYKSGPFTAVAEVGRNRAKALSHTEKLGSYGTAVTSAFPGDFRLKGAGTNFVVGGNYAFSKRTDVYVRGGRKGALNATVYNPDGTVRGKLKGHTNYVFAGLRHRF